MILGLIKDIWRQNFLLLCRTKIVWLPFSVVALVEIAGLIGLSFIPQPPLLNIFGPIIRVKWGERFLHFPYNFSLLPLLFGYLKIFISATLGALAGAWTMGIVADKITKNKFSHLLNPKASLLNSIRRYFSLLVLWIISYTLIFLTAKFIVGPLFLPRNIFLRLFTNLFVLSLWETIFIFVVPELILNRKKLFSAILLGFKDLNGRVLVSFLMVFLPILLYLPVKIIRPLTQNIINIISPELIVLLLVAGVVVVMFINVWVTSSITLLFLKKEEK